MKLLDGYKENPNTNNNVKRIQYHMQRLMGISIRTGNDYSEKIDKLCSLIDLEERGVDTTLVINSLFKNNTTRRKR